MFGIQNLENFFKGILGTLTSQDVIAKIKTVFQTIADIPHAIVQGIMTFGSMVYSGLYNLYSILSSIADFIINGLEEIWNFIKAVFSRIKHLYEYLSTLVESFVKQIWHRKIDFLAALKTSAIAYGSFRAVKKKYGDDPVKFFFGVLGIEFSQPVIYAFNKLLLSKLTENVTPAYELTSRGSILSKTIPNFELEDTTDYYDYVEFGFISKPIFYIYDTERMYDYIEFEYIKAPEETISDKETITDSTSISLVKQEGTETVNYVG